MKKVLTTHEDTRLPKRIPIERGKSASISTSDLEPDGSVKLSFLISQATIVELRELGRKVERRLKNEVRVVFAKCPRCKWSGRINAKTLGAPCLQCNPFRDEEGGRYEEMKEKEVEKYLADEDRELKLAVDRAKKADEARRKLYGEG